MGTSVEMIKKHYFQGNALMPPEQHLRVIDPETIAERQIANAPPAPALATDVETAMSMIDWEPQNTIDESETD